MLKMAQQYGVVNVVKSSQQIKESQDRNLAGIRSCENVTDNKKESCFYTVTSMVGRLKCVCEILGSEMISELHQDNFLQYL